MAASSPDLTVQEWSLPSATGIGPVQCRTYLPAEPPKLILQVIHGLAEHMGRYDAFARDLAARGIAVVCMDLAGHGLSVQDDSHLGFFAERDGWRALLADQVAITAEAAARLPGLPVFLYGHSMGSALARAYATENGSRIAGAVLSGPIGREESLPGGWLLTRLSILLHGPLYRDPKLLSVMNQGMYDRIPNHESPNAWLSADPAVVRAYDTDPLCGFCFTSAGFRDLTDLLISVQGAKWARRVPAGLAFLIVAGQDDPVGRFGKAPAALHRLLVETGHPDVQMIIYEGVRHEPHQGQGRQAMFDAVAGFLLEKAAKGGQT